MAKIIVYKDNSGGIRIVNPSPKFKLEYVISRDIPEGADYEILNRSALPKDKTFRNAWDLNDKKIITNMTKAKLIAHQIRRANRDKEMAPLDDQIAKRIPGTNERSVESKRQVIRNKYAVKQKNIDKAKSVGQIIKEI